jgi:sec-independent protein translocase protein TatB
MEKKWREENDRIMREYPALGGDWTAPEPVAPPQAPAADAPGPAEAGEADLPPQEELPLPPPERPERELP